MNMETSDYINDLSDEEPLTVVDVQNIGVLLDEEEVDVFTMTSLSNLLLVDGHKNASDGEEDDVLQRLSLAYEKLRIIPKILIQEIAPMIKILDLSHNEFDNLDFLKEFKCLTTLICDHNNITSNTTIPYMPNLELLWINHCKVASLYPWAKKLQSSSPSLKFLSLMGNPAAPSYLNGANFYEYLQYRLFIISLFPNLVHLDDKPVTNDQRHEAQRLYRKPLMDRLVRGTQWALPEYFRSISGTVSEVLTPIPSFAVPQKNVII